MLRNYIFLVSFSEFASRMNFMALTGFLLLFPSSEWNLMIFFLVRQIGGLLTSLLAGRLADNWDKRLIMLGSEIANGAAVLIPLFFYHPIAVWVSAFIMGCTYQTFYISYSSSIPEIFGAKNAYNLNALILRVSSVSSIIGFSAGGWIAENYGIQPIAVFDSFTFFTSAAVLTFLRWNSKAEKVNIIIEKKNLQFKELLNKSESLAPIWFIAFFYSLAVAGYNFSLPLLASEYEKASLMNGVFWSSAAVGSYLGSLIKRRHYLEKSYFQYLFFFSFSIAVAFSVNNIFAAACFLLIGGVFDSAGQTAAASIIQKDSSTVRGSAFGIQAFLWASVQHHRLQLL